MRRRFLLTAAAATLALVSPAVANATAVGPLSGPAGQVTLGGAASNVPAQLNWNVVGGVPNPILQGRLFMNNVPGSQARVLVEFYDDAVSHTLLNTQAGAIRTGIGGVAVFGTNIGPQAGSAHAHVELMVNGVVVNTALCTMGVPAC